MAEPGTIYIVSTPIGNLEDITLRAVRILGEVDCIAAEDTRRTRTLLEHLGISTRMVSYHDATEARRAPALIDRVRAGETIALVSDAGTPLVADPGYRLVALAAAEGLRVVPVPGASAPLALLAVSGLPTDRFRFIGFLPARAKARRDRIASLVKEEDTIVLFESARRLARTLEDLVEILGVRPAVIGRELTKKYEEVLRGDLPFLAQAVAEKDVLRGEIVLAIGRSLVEPSVESRLETAEISLQERLAAGESVSRAARAIAEESGLSRREIYALAHPKDVPER